MLKKFFNFIIILSALLLLTNITLYIINGDVNYKDLNQDITYIKKTGTIKNAIKNKKENKKYNGHGYYIIVSKKKEKTNYKVYIKNKSIWEYNKIKSS